MAMGDVVNVPTICSFCLRRRQDVTRLINGPLAAICDECVSACVAVLQKVSEEDAARLAEEKSEEKSGPFGKKSDD